MKNSLLTIFSLMGFLFMSSIMLIAHGLVMPLSSEEILENMDLILLGTVKKVQFLDDKTSVFEIEVEQVIKPTTFDALTVFANGCDPNKKHFGTSCLSYEVGDRGLFLLYELAGNDKYYLSFRSITSESKCNAYEFLASYRGFEPHFFFTQNEQSEEFFTGIPVNIHYVITNQDMKEKDYSVKLSAFGNNVDFSNILNGTIRECIGYETVTTSFIPDSMGMYGFNAESQTVGDTFYGLVIIDHGTSPLKQFHTGIPAQDIWCKNDLFLILKNDDTKPRFDNVPACVSKNTIIELVERDRGYIPEESQFFEELEDKSFN